jgi:hypothetical protein
MKLVSKLILTLLISALILLFLEKLTKFGLEHNKNFKLAYIQKHPVNAGLIIQGPCEAEWTVDPEVLNKYLPYPSYNLAIHHTDFADNYIYLKEYLEHQPKPKAILIYVSPESFDSTMSNIFNSYSFSFLLNDKRIKEVVAEMDPVYSSISLIPFLKYSYYSNFIFYKSLSGWVNYFQKDTLPLWPSGYAAPTHSYRRPIHNFEDLHPEVRYFKWSALREKYFIEIIRLLKSKNIRLIVYESPIYYEALAYQKNRAEQQKKIDSICRVYAVDYLRFDSLPMQYNKNLYFSSTNTTMAGNEVFNPILAKALKDTLAHN